MKKKGVVILFDLEPSFSRIDWELLGAILLAKGFGT